VEALPSIPVRRRTIRVGFGVLPCKRASREAADGYDDNCGG